MVDRNRPTIPQRDPMLKVDRAILHVFDFDSGSTYLSERPLDLTVRATRSFVQRHLRKISANAESRHGAFAPDSGFADELQRYLAGEREFVEFSTEIAQWFWEELRRTEDLEQCDLLVADFTDTDATGEGDGEDAGPSFDGPAGRRFFSVMLLPRRQAFVHEVAGDANDIARVDATLPNPSQKVASYLLVDAETGAIDFHDKERAVGGERVSIIPERFLQCTSEASSHEVIDEVSVIVRDVAEEFGLEPAVEAARVKAAVARSADMEESFSPAEVGRTVFAERPEVAERFEERVQEARLPEEAPVRRGVANRLTRSHKIRTDTGVEISFPSELAERPGYLDFSTDAEGRITITVGNVARIENR